MPRILSVNDHTPVIAADAFVAPDVTIAGDVVIASGASVWFGCVLRSERARLRIGADTNVQDLTVGHTDPDFPLLVGDRVTIGHRAVLHGCVIDDDVLVGMGAVVMNGARIGRGAVVAAGALVTEGTDVPPLTLAVGVPAKPLDRDVPDVPRHNVDSYLDLAELYRRTLDGP